MGDADIIDYFPQEVPVIAEEYTATVTQVISQYVRYERAVIDTEVTDALIELHHQGRAYLGRNGPGPQWLLHHWPRNAYIREHTDVRIHSMYSVSKLGFCAEEQQRIIQAGNRIYSKDSEQMRRFVREHLLQSERI